MGNDKKIPSEMGSYDCWRLPAREADQGSIITDRSEDQSNWRHGFSVTPKTL